MKNEPWKQELYHHGILGMRWGKRNGPPYPLSPGDHSATEKKAGWRKSLKEKKQIKKDIKQAKRNYRHKTGVWFTTGENVANVDERRASAQRNDKQLKEISSRREDIYNRMLEEESKMSTTGRRKDYMQRVQNDPNVDSETRRLAEKDYLEAKEASKNSRQKITELDNEYDILDNAYYDRNKQIIDSFYNDYKDALVKDLNYDPSMTDKIESYGLMKYALRFNGRT